MTEKELRDDSEVQKNPQALRMGWCKDQEVEIWETSSHLSNLNLSSSAI